MIWLILSVVLVAAMFILPLFTNAARYLQHTLYLSGTLGAGKTSFAAWAVRRFLKRGYTVYSTFHLDGAIPFDLSADPWPLGEKTVVVLDEMLWLRLERFFTDAHLSGGLTMARQRGQIVMILSQSHLTDLGALDGPIQVFSTTVPLLKTRFGNLNMMRFASNKFKRTGKIKAPGMKTVLVWIPSSVFKTYNSRKIFGFTCDKSLSDFTEQEMKTNAIRRAARFRLEKQLADQLARDEARRMVESGEADRLMLGGPASRREAQTPPTAAAAGTQEGARVRSVSGGPSWHRPGGGRGRR